ncbi:MAG: tRNA pseudouridine(55) synthase [Kiritimatiellia bacterium]
MAKLDSIAMLADLDGLLLVDKPLNMSSHDVVKAVKSHFNLVKASPGGTLEPNASGLLVLLLGDATRLGGDLMSADRGYTAELVLGRETNTCDAEGELVAEASADGVTREALEAALKELRGDVFQTPPPFSVIKMPQHPGYDVIAVDAAERKPRLVHFYRSAVTEFAAPKVVFDLLCGKGASIQAFAHDLGALLGCGASVAAFRRTTFGKFSVEQAIPFLDLLKLDAVDFRNRLLPMAGALIG